MCEDERATVVATALLAAVTKAGGSRQVVAAVACALYREVLAPTTSLAGDCEELQARVGAIVPVLREKIAAAADGRGPRVSGGHRAQRNVAEHDFKEGAVAAVLDPIEARRRQRGGQKHARRCVAVAGDAYPLQRFKRVDEAGCPSSLPNGDTEYFELEQGEAAIMMEVLDVEGPQRWADIADSESSCAARSSEESVTWTVGPQHVPAARQECRFIREFMNVFSLDTVVSPSAAPWRCFAWEPKSTWSCESLKAEVPEGNESEKSKKTVNSEQSECDTTTGTSDDVANGEDMLTVSKKALKMRVKRKRKRIDIIAGADIVEARANVKAIPVEELLGLEELFHLEDRGHMKASRRRRRLAWVI